MRNNNPFGSDMEWRQFWRYVGQHVEVALKGLVSLNFRRRTRTMISDLERAQWRLHLLLSRPRLCVVVEWEDLAGDHADTCIHQICKNKHPEMCTAKLILAID